jgi:tetratricopeptide (TPR) repeat protein
VKVCKTLTAISLILTVPLGSPLQAQTSAPELPPLARLAPPFTANKLLILGKLRQKDFAGLDSEFEQYQVAFEKSPRAELNEKLAFDSFAADDPSVGDLIEEWTIARPNSFAAHMAMGSYFSWRGWHTRGAGFADQTPSGQFDKMGKFFAQSAEETKMALKLKPKLSIAYAVLLGEARGESDRTVHETLERDALRQIPASFVIREEVMESMYPRWGGSHEMMAEFAQQSQALVKENPYMHWLRGFIDSDEGEMLGIHGEYDQSIVALTRAIQKGDDYSGFYFIRGESYGQSGLWEHALQDFDRNNELSPQDPEVLIRRAYPLAELKRPKEVLADLQVVNVFEAPNDLSTQLHDWAVKASKVQH